MRGLFQHSAGRAIVCGTGYSRRKLRNVVGRHYRRNEQGGVVEMVLVVMSVFYVEWCGDTRSVLVDR